MKYALLDTDFISKTYTVGIDDNNRLIDRVLEMPGYSFICHDQTVAELKRHNSSISLWLEEKIKSGIIDKYTDERILKEMSELYFQLAPHQYTNMVKTACDAFGADYFADHYTYLDTLNYRNIPVETYLKKLNELELNIGSGNNLGEIKAYILLQWLGNQLGDQVFYFCSDDKNARNGVLVIDGINVHCITLVSAYQRLHVESKHTYENALPYINAILDFFSAHGQMNIRVIEASKTGRHMKVPCEQVFREIYDDKYEELANGLLKYRK